jgi:hypothetical protein
MSSLGSGMQALSMAIRSDAAVRQRRHDVDAEAPEEREDRFDHRRRGLAAAAASGQASYVDHRLVFARFAPALLGGVAFSLLGERALGSGSAARPRPAARS